MANSPEPKFMEKNDRDDIGVYISEFNGIDYLHVREMWIAPRTGDRNPTKKGVTLNIEKGVELYKLLGDLLTEIGALKAN
jgi:hypothetical protein